MTNERTHELISAAADGALNDYERVELDQLLKGSAEACRLRSELGLLASILENAPQPVPPATLHDQIMARVTLPASRARRPVFAWRPEWTATGVLRYGLAAAAGVILAVFFYESQPRSGTAADLADLVGTMAPHRARSAADVMDTYRFRSEGFECLVQLERSEGGLLLDIQVDAARPLDIAVDLGSARARLVALLQDQKPLESIAIADQTLRVQALGRRQLTALLVRADETVFTGEAKIELEFSSEGELLQHGSLTPAW